MQQSGAGGSSVVHRNQVGKYAAKVMKSEFNRVNAQLSIDIQHAIEGHCIYLPNFMSPKYNYAILKTLAYELEAGLSNGMVSWSRHLKHEDPTFSPTFKAVIQQLSYYFDVEVFASRLNFYRNGTDWKPYHHDSHAYGAKGKREDFTIGASFGATRSLSFLHPDSGTTFEFPQWNGDVFAFTSTANKRFQHGVPRSSKHGPRFSIIAWGRRRRLTPRNSSIEEQKQQLDHDIQDAGPEPEHIDAFAFASAKLKSIEALRAKAGEADVANRLHGAHGETESRLVSENVPDDSLGRRTTEEAQDPTLDVPQITEVSKSVTEFCRSMERYSELERQREEKKRANAAKQYAGESAATASDPAQQKENQHKRDKRDKRAKSDKKKSKQGKKRGQKVKSRVQGSWGR